MNGAANALVEIFLFPALFSGATVLLCLSRERFKSNLVRTFLGGLAVALPAVVSAGILQGSFHHFIFIVGLLYILIFCLAVLVIAAIDSAVRNKSLRPVKISAFLWCACGLGAALSYGMGFALNSWQIATARAYVARAIPLLDQAKAKDGAFPAVLPVGILGQRPALLREAESYSSDGKEFHFQYSDPAQLLGEGAQMDSNSRSWTYYDPMG